MIGTRLVSVSDTVQRVTLEIGDFRSVVFNSSSVPVYIGFHPSVDAETGYAIFPGKTIKLPTGYTSFYCVSSESANIYIGCQNLTVRSVTNNDVCINPITLLAGYEFESDLTDSIDSYDLTEVNTPTYVTGVHGQSSALDAASSQHFTKTPGTPWLFSGDFLICGYIRHTTNSSNRGICSIYNATGNQKSWLFRIASTKLALTLSSDGSTETTFTTTRAVVNNVWQYVMAWRVSGDVGISIGAYVEDLGTFSDSLFSSSAILRIGAEASGNPFPGNIDELVFLSGNFSDYLGWIRNDGFGRSVNDILTYVGN